MYPTIGFGGFYYGHSSQEIKDRQGAKAKKGYQNRLSRARASKLSSQLHKAQNETYDNKEVKGGAELQRWFQDRRKEMKGICSHCGGKSCKDSDTYYKFSIAHILPKAYFKSVATHPLNYIELCHFGKSCHDNFDRHMIDIMDLNCFDEVITKFVAMYPSIAPNERRRIPEVLLQYIEVEK
jgi:hypothetical protein